MPDREEGSEYGIFAPVGRFLLQARLGDQVD